MRRRGRLLAGAFRARDRALMRRRDRDRAPEDRIVPPASESRGAEAIVIALFFAGALCAAAFMVIYGFDRLGNQNQLLGIALGLSLAFLAAALITMAKLLLVTEEKEEDYPEPEHPAEQEAIEQLVEESATPLTRKRLLAVAGGTAGGALLLAALTPALSLGPWTDTDPLYRTPWRRGRRLVDRDGRPWQADDIGQTFYTAYPEGAEPPRDRRSGGRRACRPVGTSAAARARRLGAPGHRRLLEDLHPRGLRGRAVPEADVPAGAAQAGAGLPVPLLDVRPRPGGDGDLRPRRTAAAAASAR